MSGGNFNTPFYSFTDDTDNPIDINTFKFMRNRTYKFKSINYPFNIFVNDTTLNLGTGSTTEREFKIKSVHNLIPGQLYYECGAHSNMKNVMSLLTKNVSGTTADGSYDFYYGDISINVLDNFENVSVYCYYHGYMGGENLLQYDTTCSV